MKRGNEMTTYMFNMKTFSLKTAEKGYSIWINDKNMGYSTSLPNARKKAVTLLKRDGAKYAYISKVNERYAIGKVWLNWKGQGVWATGNKAHIIYKDGSIGPGEQYME